MRLALGILAGMLAAADLPPEARVQRALEAARRGDCNVAIPELQAILKADGRIVPALNALAVCEASSGHSEQAAATFERVTQLEPNAWQAWNNLGASRLSNRQPKLAVEALEKAVKLEPGAANAWFHLGTARQELRHPAQAYDAFDRAQRLAPSDQAITKSWFDAAGELATQASDHIEKKEFAQARSLLVRVSRPLEGSASWNNLLGYTEFKLGHPEAALAHLQKALRLEPDNEDYLLDLGEFLGHHRAPQNAVELFEVASLRMANSPRVRFGLAVSYILVGRREDAVKLLVSLVDANPKFEPAYRALGECYEDAGNWDGLVRLGKQLQGVNPANAGGWYFEGAGRLKNAAEDSVPDPQSTAALLRAAALDPASSRIHFTLAKAYQQSGQSDLAVRELRETIRLEPQHERAHYVLARLYQKLGQSEAARREMAAHSRIKVADRAAQYRALLITSRNP